MTGNAYRDAGFTMIESLIALAVLALMAVALLGATEAHITQISGLEARSAAEWTAQNQLALMELGQPAAETVTTLGFDFLVEVEETPSTDPVIFKVGISVTDQRDGQVYRGITGFIDRGIAQ